MKSAKNISASVRARLLNIANEDKRPFNELLQRYAMERFLYRLSLSQYADCFILKGALLLRVWRFTEVRPTMDIDMLGKTSSKGEDIVAKLKEIMLLKVESDGIRFYPDSVILEPIDNDAPYEGVRARFNGSLDEARIVMQIDIGFSDVIYPGPEERVFPTLLNYPAPRILCYSRESVVAEKFEAMVKLGTYNSRMKDFYDIWLLSRRFDFDGASLAEAIRLTFNRRETELLEDIEAFSGDFIDAKQKQWSAFVNKLKQENIPESFKEIVTGVEEFLKPLISNIINNNREQMSWNALKGWRQERPSI